MDKSSDVVEMEEIDEIALVVEDVEDFKDLGAIKVNPTTAPIITVTTIKSATVIRETARLWLRIMIAFFFRKIIGVLIFF